MASRELLEWISRFGREQNRGFSMEGPEISFLNTSRQGVNNGKTPRMVEMFARRLQVQERMTTQIAQFLQDVLQPRGVAVVVDGSYLCAMMRGVKKPQATITTTTLRVDFKDDPELRAEFQAYPALPRARE